MADKLDTLVAAYREDMERDLVFRRRKERTEDRAAERKAKRAGFAGDLCIPLTIPRRHWPAVHETAKSNGVPLVTARLEATDPGHQLTIRTTTAGYLYLQNTLDGRK